MSTTTLMNCYINETNSYHILYGNMSSFSFRKDSHTRVFILNGTVCADSWLYHLVKPYVVKNYFHDNGLMFVVNMDYYGSVIRQHQQAILNTLHGAGVKYITISLAALNSAVHEDLSRNSQFIEGLHLLDYESHNNSLWAYTAQSRDYSSPLSRSKTVILEKDKDKYVSSIVAGTPETVCQARRALRPTILANLADETFSHIKQYGDWLFCPLWLADKTAKIPALVDLLRRKGLKSKTLPIITYNGYPARIERMIKRDMPEVAPFLANIGPFAAAKPVGVALGKVTQRPHKAINLDGPHLIYCNAAAKSFRA